MILNKNSLNIISENLVLKAKFALE